MLVSKAMAHCRRAVGTRNRHYDEHQNGGRKCSSGDDALGDDDYTTTAMETHHDDTRPVKIREVTMLIKELGALCTACQGDMARMGVAPGSDAFFGFLTARCVSWSAAVMILVCVLLFPHQVIFGGGVLGYIL